MRFDGPAVDARSDMLGRQTTSPIDFSSATSESEKDHTWTDMVVMLSGRGAATAESHDARPHALRTAIEIMEAEAHTALTVAEVAARSHGSVRALQYALRRHMQISPMTYLRDIRLRRAHQALVGAEPSMDSVTSICYRWRFTNLGRFAALHTTHYGESPSATLYRINI